MHKIRGTIRKEYKHKGAKTIMKYDFTKIIDRQGKDAIAIDMVGKPGGFAPDGPKDGWDVIPMWIADMNFETVPTIPEAIIERTKHPLYGYFSPTEEYFGSIIKWQETRNGVTGLLPEHIGYENGDFMVYSKDHATAPAVQELKCDLSSDSCEIEEKIDGTVTDKTTYNFYHCTGSNKFDIWDVTNYNGVTTRIQFDDDKDSYRVFSKDPNCEEYEKYYVFPVG